MEISTKILLVFVAVYLGTTMVLAKSPQGNQFLFITNQTCAGDSACDVCKNISLPTTSGNGSTYGTGYTYGSGYTSNPSNNPAPPVDITGQCTPLGPYQSFCIFCSLTGIFDVNCPRGYCACGATAYNTEVCGFETCGTDYKLLTSEFRRCP